MPEEGCVDTTTTLVPDSWAMVASAELSVWRWTEVAAATSFPGTALVLHCSDKPGRYRRLLLDVSRSGRRQNKPEHGQKEITEDTVEQPSVCLFNAIRSQLRFA